MDANETEHKLISLSIILLSYHTEICLLTNAKRVASVRAETYSNLFSLAVEHFNSVLDQYPLMRRTMESIAAERLNKIGKNPSMVSQREDLETDLQAVNELLLAQEEVDMEGANCDSSGHHGDHGSLGTGSRLTGGLFRVKSESCFRLSNIPSMIKPAAIAATSGSSSGGNAQKNTEQPKNDGSNSNGADNNSDQQQSSPGGASASGGVNQSKSSFNLHNLLR